MLELSNASTKKENIFIKNKLYGISLDDNYIRNSCKNKKYKNEDGSSYIFNIDNNDYKLYATLYIWKIEKINNEL